MGERKGWVLENCHKLLSSWFQFALKEQLQFYTYSFLNSQLNPSPACQSPAKYTTIKTPFEEQKPPYKLEWVMDIIGHRVYKLVQAHS